MSFDEANLVPNAGLLPAAVLAQRIDLAGLVDARLHLARHGANSGAKALTVIGSMLAGGDSIDDVAVLRAGAAGALFDGTRAPSTVGSWLRAHKWSNVRQLDAISRELLAELVQARLALRRYAVNVNQIAAALNSSGAAPVWLDLAVAGADRAVARLDAVAQRPVRRLT